MLPSEWRDVERVLVLRLDNIGDVVMLGPALRAIKQTLPWAHLSLLASRAGTLVVPLLPWVDSVLTRTVVWQDAFASMPLDPEREIDFIAALAQAKFDAAIIFTSFGQTPYAAAYACYLAAIPIRAGLARDFGGSVLSHPVASPRDEMHQAERNLYLVQSLGFDSSDSSLELFVPDESVEWVDTVLSANGVSPDMPYILVAPAASCQARTYPLPRFLEVIRGLREHVGMPVIVVGSEREGKLKAELEAIVDDGVISLVGATSVPDFAELCRRASLVVGNDSAVMHLSDAFGVPQVILFSGTDLESQWWPRRSHAVLLRRPTPCAPCYLMNCRYALECLDIDPSEVVGHCLSVLRDADDSVRSEGRNSQPLRGRGKTDPLDLGA